MRRICWLHPDVLFAGARLLRVMLNDAAIVTGRKLCRSLMRKAGH